jgi:L,D-peptidoglycan transpeptidase YkuD (ErfK/YbiS/YcfS/YnhG family)
MFLFSHEQIMLVIGDNINSQKATLFCFENNRLIFTPIEVNIGKNGFGQGVGEKELSRNILLPIKKEGDKKTPSGIFHLEAVFGYEKELNITMPYLHADENLICIDDSNSNFYNKIIKQDTLNRGQKPKSFEQMRRDDNQYELGIVVAHNKDGLKERGSCIFVHVQESQGTPTAGCISMRLIDLEKIVYWLDKEKKPIIIQIVASQLDEVLKLYPMLEFK